jgi:hypothetical protein
MREWLVIECSYKRAVFPPKDAEDHEGYIPRDVVEGELGIRIDGDGRTTWFTREDGERMRAHPEWRKDPPPGPNIHPALGFWNYTGPHDAKAVKGQAQA